MIKIISPDQFKKIPWKNGKGETRELAISKKGTLADFDWRLSMASVVEDGEFSDFTGYRRNLILISGNGIELQYGRSDADRLENCLGVLSFDGGRKTVGRLISGPITDFNLIYKADKYRAVLNTYTDRHAVKLSPCTLCFVYCLNETAALTSNTINISLSAGHLMQLIVSESDRLQVTGKNMIVIHLTALDT